MYPINDAKAVPLANCANAISLNDNSALLPYLSFSTDTSFMPANRYAANSVDYVEVSLRVRRVHTTEGHVCRVAITRAENITTSVARWVNRLLAGKAVSKVLWIKVNLGSPPASTIHPIAGSGSGGKALGKQARPGKLKSAIRYGSRPISRSTKNRRQTLTSISRLRPKLYLVRRHRCPGFAQARDGPY